ncbi:hypothetical protein EZS27_030233 [termite gut metagenome]|uniref:DUF1573 domain-containing protein n=1 Tax=termite gut metagenome TaxID=433724 RepID=A0A5J4QE12_9ZZZZ
MKNKNIFLFSIIVWVVGCGNNVWAQNEAEIRFEVLMHDFGTFSEKAPVVSCEFKFTNVGNSPLIIHQAIASCGCTVPQYTKEPVMPGKQGMVTITYNGTGKYPGYFKKSITLRTNGKPAMVRLFIEGNMKGVDEK